jgi:hypothetical protein
MNKKTSDLPLLEEKQGNINLCHPFISDKAIEYVTDTLKSR